MRTRDWIYIAVLTALTLFCFDLSLQAHGLRRQVAALANPELPTRWEFALHTPGRPELPIRRHRGYTSSFVDGTATIFVDERAFVLAPGEVKP